MAEEPKQDQENTNELRKRWSWRRRLFVAGGGVAIFVLAIGLIGVILLQTGVVNSYIQTTLTERLDEMGIVFKPEAFRFSPIPLELHISKASFNDKLSGERLFYIGEAHIKMTLLEALSLSTSRDISIDKTDISGAEVWVKFDENGKSNFSNLKFVEDEAGSSVNFRYESVNFSLTDSIVHFGDQSRRIGGDARNIAFVLTPEQSEAAKLRSRFDLTSTDSNFS